jgi:phenylalanyl-tRNA synthetase beta chain
MRILERWLKQYIDFSIPPREVADKLTMLGLEFESVERLDRRYDRFVVGRVLAKDQHPNADKLSVCTVEVGAERLQIVCGASNVAAGQNVAVGLIGATVPRNQHDPGGAPFVLTKVKLRGIESSGMICSEYELDLGKDADGILVLDEDAVPGQTLASYFGMDDVGYDIEITPNRPDWLSHFGVAREIAVLTGHQPKRPSIKLKEGKEPVAKYLKVKVEAAADCPRFAARMIRGVSIGPSPRWLQNALRNVGLRPRNNVVDITNYVMYEYGHPMHAFDHRLLAGGTIVVRKAKGGTPFTTLDGKIHMLPDGAVMVCDAEREVSIAGVMGGANSEINDATTDIVLEAAYWNPASIRRTARALGISSDASQRFERGADPNGARYALDRAAELVLDLAGGVLLKGAVDVYPKKIRERVVPLRVSRVNAVLGTSLAKSSVVKMLGLLGILPAKLDGETLKFRVPTFRVDIEREIDLIEEVARVFGYDNIDDKASARVTFTHDLPRSDFRNGVREALVGRGFQEAVTNSMHQENRAALGGVVPVKILNPQNQEMTVLRSTLVPGLLDVVARNQNLGNPDLRLFEIGHVFRMDDSPARKIVENFLEEERVCLLMTGRAAPVQWSEGGRQVDFFDLKGEVTDLLAKFALDKSRFISYSTTNGLTDDTLTIEIQGSYAGYFGKVRRDLLVLAGVEQPVYVAEVTVDVLRPGAKKIFVPLPKYPRVRRDLAFTVDAGIGAENLERTIRDSGGDLLQAVELFDVYVGEPLPPGKKSVAFALALMSREKTLTESEIDAAVRRVAESVEKVHGASLRKT